MKATPSRLAMETALQTLEACGFEAAGRTSSARVRVPVRGSPIYGSGGGKLATLGGRRRLSKPGTEFLATVGVRTLCLYRRGGKDMATLDTGDAQALLDALAQRGLVPGSTSHGVTCKVARR